MRTSSRSGAGSRRGRRAGRASGHDAHRGRGAGRAGARGAVAAARAAPAALSEIASADPYARASTRWASPIPTWCVGFAGASTIPPTLSFTHAMRAMWSVCSSGARASAWRRSRSAEVHRLWAGSARMSARDTTVWCRSTWCARSRARGGRGLTRRADSGRRARPELEAQLGEHGLTLRHFPQSFEYSLWVAGSPRAPPAISRPCGRTSRISSSRCERSRQWACGSRGGCPDRAPD